MKLEIITPEQIYFSGEVSMVTLPGTVGSFTLWDQHAPLISSLKSGVIAYETPTGNKELNIDGGFVEVSNNVVTVCIELI